MPQAIIMVDFSSYGFVKRAKSGICQWKLDTLLNNLDSKGRVEICFG